MFRSVSSLAACVRLATLLALVAVSAGFHIDHRQSDVLEGAILDDYFTYDMFPVNIPASRDQTSFTIPSSRDQPVQEHDMQESNTKLEVLMNMLGKLSKRSSPSQPRQRSLPRDPHRRLSKVRTERHSYTGKTVPRHHDRHFVARTPPSHAKRESLRMGSFATPKDVHGTIALDEQYRDEAMISRCAGSDHPDCYEWMKYHVEPEQHVLHRFNPKRRDSADALWLSRNTLVEQPRGKPSRWPDREPFAQLRNSDVSLEEDGQGGLGDLGAFFSMLEDSVAEPRKRGGKRGRALSLDSALRVIPVQIYSTPAERKASSRSRLEIIGRK